MYDISDVHFGLKTVLVLRKSNIATISPFFGALCRSRLQVYGWPIEITNNKARHNLIDAKYQQMAFQSVPTIVLLGIWSNKSDANLKDSDCTVPMLLFVSIAH